MTESLAVLKAASDKHRLAILKLLSKGRRTVSQLEEALHLDQSLVSHHLQVLRRASLVDRTRQGRTAVYALRRRVDIDLGCCRISFR